MRLPSFDLRQFRLRPGARAAGGGRANLLHRSRIDRRGRLSPRAPDISEDGCDLSVGERVSVGGHEPDRSFFALQQNTNGNARVANDVWRAGDIGRRARLLATISTVAPLTRVLVDLLSCIEPRLIGRAQRCRCGRHAWLSRPSDAREHFDGAIPELSGLRSHAD